MFSLEAAAAAERRFVVTGASSGIGLEAARAFALAGAAHVVFAVRSPDKTEPLVAALRKECAAHSSAAVRCCKVSIVRIDVSEMTSVRAAARELRELLPAGIDALVCNAGVMAIGEQRTSAGYEMQVATNYLGHALLVAELLDVVAKSQLKRIVMLSSATHHGIWFQTLTNDRILDLACTKYSYSKFGCYMRSNLVRLVFMFELARRLERAGGAASQITVVACHPGWASTNLQFAGKTVLERSLASLFNLFGAQSAEQGAWPTELAATDPTAKSGDYYGPSRFFEMWGVPRKGCFVRPKAREPELGAALWQATARLLDVDLDRRVATAAALRL